MVNIKKMTDELRLFSAQKISANAVNVTTGINDTTDRKFDQPKNRLYEIDTRVNETKTLAENNTSRSEQLEEKIEFKVRTILQKDRTIRRAC